MPIKQAAPRQHHFMQITSQQIEEIRAGKIKTFEILFNAYYPRVKSFAFGMIKDQYEAEEIAQNVFLKLWSNREKLSSDNTLSSYIFTIVQNEVYDFFREKHYSLGYQEKMLSTPQNLPYVWINRGFWRFRHCLRIVLGSFGILSFVAEACFATYD